MDLEDLFFMNLRVRMRVMLNIIKEIVYIMEIMNVMILASASL